MHMSLATPAASMRRLAIALAAAGGLGMLLPAAVDRAQAIEPSAVQSTPAKRTPNDALPSPIVAKSQQPREAPEGVSEAAMREVPRSGPEPVSPLVLGALLADPDVRGFVGTAENAWDFTRPETIPGFGRLP
jgi:hypothetical protein